ncbi:aminopeptidase N [Kribbella albertanoniae]|uniref:Aminopeptidase N n=1 Tax=Kribbella albertanoniae TaxID=1266829 RepID=A0A4R4P699_9ACTN|nr:aminopeptidase N [Kribbella albertanoniae]TDC16353.1 aminopeptidase N [Kribbella albertanoniae]
MRALTVDEARQRATDLALGSYLVDFDLTDPGDTFEVTSRIRFTAVGDTSWVDVKPERLLSVELNGQSLDPELLADGRFPLTGLQAENELVIHTVQKYSVDGEGLVRSVDAADGRVYTYGMSSLESAPRYYPCFDQPDLKAPYTVTVKCPEDWVVLGNGAATQTAPGEWALAETKPLSTYFVAIAAGPFHLIRSQYDGISLGLACRQSLKESLEADAEDLFRTTRDAFDAYHRMFAQRYMFGEYWQVFVPDFNLGAMENPGCVTVSDDFLYRAQTTEAERSTRSRVLVHEMAHMWFGDLVTMKWWNDMWLNESFAEYMAHRVAEEATSYQGNWTDFAFVRKWWGMQTDQSSSTHPVAPESLKDARQSLDDFDGISYAKGAAVLKQLAKYLGDDVFLKGVNAHLAAHEYGNADLAEFITKLTEAGATGLANWSEQWLQTSGLDTLTAERTATGVILHRQSPDDSRRPHTLTVGGYDEAGAPTIVELVLAGDTAEVALSNDIAVIVPDAQDDTWVKIRLDEITLANLPAVLPKIADSTTRAVIWNAVRDATMTAELDPRQALNLFATTVGDEDSDVAVESLVRWLTERVVGGYLPYDESRAVVADALEGKLASVEPGSSLQLATARGFVATTNDSELLKSWLTAERVPRGLEIGQDLRWAILLRLVRLDAAGELEIVAEHARDQSSEGAVEAARCRAASPAGKEAAWTRIMTDPEIGVRELLATAEGFWHPGQSAITAPYVGRFFTEIAGTADIRAGMVLMLTTMRIVPKYAIDADLIGAAEALSKDETVTSGIRRAVANYLDDLRRAVEVRHRYS